MSGSQKHSKGAGEQPSVDTYEGRANKFYNMKQSGQTTAVVETVFRKPKPFANLHEYDDTETVDQVPTAIGFHSFDSADEVNEAKMKSRYHFEELTEKESEESEPKDKEKVPGKEKENQKNDYISSEQLPVPFHKVILRKVEQRAPNEKVKGQSEESQSLDGQKNEEEVNGTEKVEEECKGNDRYGLGQSVFSDDDSCPPLWKSFSDEKNGKLDGGEAAIKEKARRQNALNEARKLRALNSVFGVDSTPSESEIEVDPRLRRKRNEESYNKQAGSMQTTSCTRRKVVRAGENGKMRKKSVQKNVVSSKKNGKEPTSIVSNSIIASQPTPRKVAIKALTVDKRFDDASYGSEGQSKGSVDKQRTIPTGADGQAEAEQSFAAYVYEGLTNLTNVNYWIGEQASSDGSHEGSDDASRGVCKMSSKAHANGASKCDPNATKLISHAVVSEITIPTPTVRNKGEPQMEDSVSILGLDKKQSNMDPMENGENRVPQKQVKRKGKSRVFGRILGRKAAA